MFWPYFWLAVLVIAVGLGMAVVIPVGTAKIVGSIAIVAFVFSVLRAYNVYGL